MKHQIKLALGNLKRASFTTGLNIVGLTSAFTAFILIMVYVWNERHFDCYNEHVNEIYRLEMKSPDNPKSSVYMLGPTGKTLVEEFPEIEASTIYIPWGRLGETVFSWEKQGEEIKSFEDYAYSDEYLSEIFTFNFVKGKLNKPLLEPQSAIISESFARKAWGTADPIGKQLKRDGSLFTVTAVFADLPENTVIQCPIILKLSTTWWLGEEAQKWNMTNYPQFIKVKPGTDGESLNKRINQQSIVREKYKFYNNGTVAATLIARPLRDLRFTVETSENPMYSANNQMFVDSLFWVGILILLIALINYVNFATANIPRRIKSISISRIIGSSKLNSIMAFVFETNLLFVVSFGLALALTYFINQEFTRQIFGYALPISGNYKLLIIFGLIALLMGCFAGLYPAFYSTSRKPVETLKRFQINSKVNFRGMLTVTQFAATIVLIAVSTLVIKQVRFMEKTDLGFNKNNTLVIHMDSELRKNYKLFENKLKSNPLIGQVARSRAVPGQAQEMVSFEVEGKTCPIWYWASDEKYIDMMGFKLVEGRNFLKDSQAENGNMICNESAARKYGWKLGTRINNHTLVGILKDFNFISLREEVDPFAFWYSDYDDFFFYTSIKLSGDNPKQAIASVEKIYNEYCTDTPFRYFFLDDHMNMLYSKEAQQVKLITTFSILSVIVSVLGILGLSTFMCQYRIKEIGIRKVNGAKVLEMMTMLNRDFVKWVVIAFLIAIPFSWYVMSQWLESFAYKTNLSWWIFVLSGATALGIALLTVSWQSWKAATRNPVEALRYE